MEERNYWLGFSGFPGIGPGRFRKILGKFKTAKNGWSAEQTSLNKIFGNELGEKLGSFRRQFSIKDYLNKLKEKKVWYLTLLDKEYPQLLREIKNPPFVLYGRGDIEVLIGSSRSLNNSSEPSGNKNVLLIRQSRISGDARLQNSENQASNSASLSKIRHQSETQPNFSSPENELPRSIIAVVGTRRTTYYGREVTKLLTTELVLAGFTIVSGLALGVDAISHMTALELKGKTIAVLGCGVDCCSPMENLSLYNSILEKGSCIVSEFPLGMKPTLWTFPARNRIIAGLSQAVLVTEGAEDSGSLITAKLALRFNRRVFAVPGPITSNMSKGPYKLIAKGAKLVISAGDILQELKSQISDVKTKSQISKISRATEEEREILDLLQSEALHFDEIVRRTKLNSSQLSSLLTLMEIKGMVKSSEGGMFSL